MEEESGEQDSLVWDHIEQIDHRAKTKSASVSAEE
jgi:hypothetical protein